MRGLPIAAAALPGPMSRRIGERFCRLNARKRFASELILLHNSHLEIIVIMKLISPSERFKMVYPQHHLRAKLVKSRPASKGINVFFFFFFVWGGGGGGIYPNSLRLDFNESLVVPVISPSYKFHSCNTVTLLFVYFCGVITSFLSFSSFIITLGLAQLS